MSRVSKIILMSLIVVAGSIAFVPDAKAMVFAPGIFYSNSTTDDQTIPAKYGVTELRADMRLLFSLTQSLLFGGMYRYESVNQDSSAKMTGSEIGPSLAYVSGGFSMTATVFLLGDRNYDYGTSQSKHSSLTGYQIDLAWTPALTASMGLGPVLSYHSLKFGKTKIGAAAETSDSVTETEINPGFMLWFNF